jgi:hypothetical protein
MMKASKPASKMALSERAKFQRLVIYHDHKMIGLACGQTAVRVSMFGRAYITVPPDPIAQRVCGYHEAQLRWTTRELGETRAAIRAQQRARERQRTRASHVAGWSCITNGAYSGAPHEGNGYNGPYTGPLGMTDPWMGYSSPGSDWVHTPVGVVYAIAEKVAAQYGFSYSFMAHQWPNTYPPCAGYF